MQLVATKEEFTVRPLGTEDAQTFGSLLRSQSAAYVRFFTPFAFDRATVSSTLALLYQDIFMGLYWREKLVGFFMLRGWDEGYDVPSYGVLVDEKFNGYGLAVLSLRAAKTICKLSSVPRIMLKVYPKNVRAKRIFERAGFLQTGIDPGSDYHVYHFDFDGTSKKI